jgi:RNA polymerase sigma factor (sigma-70 family)
VEPNLRARLRAGDPDAFGLVFDHYAHAVYNLGFRLTANWSAAEEVVSLTFLEAWRLRDGIAPGSEPLRPWLLGIAVNVSRNLARASRRHQAALGRLPSPPPVPDFADELAGRLDDAAQLREVGKALATLRRGEREVIALCVWSELDYATAARALGVPVGTVRSRLSRARRKLRKLVPVAREPADGREQVPGDRENAARPAPAARPIPEETDEYR